MPRKLNYSDPKMLELLEVLNSLGFTYEKTKDSLDVTVTKETKKVLSRELSRINGIFKSPPLSTQYDESIGIISIFDQRL